MALSPITAVKQVVESARTWAKTRAQYRKLMDSKSASDADLKKVKKRYAAASDRHEKVVLAFDAIYESFKKIQGRPPKGAFPWRAFFGMVSNTAAAAAQAMQPPGAPAGRPQRPVIDVTGETVDPRR